MARIPQGTHTAIKGKVIGGIYDNRFLVKETKSSALMLKDAGRELPYQSAKEMFLMAYHR